MVNVHASGGARMMTAAKEALASFGADAPLLIAVTVLTSMEAEDLRGIGIEASPAEHAERPGAPDPRLRAGRRGVFGTRSAAAEGGLRAGIPAGYAGDPP